MNKLEQAAQALLGHWDTPMWKDVKPTADLMADLREALAEQVEQEPVAWFVQYKNRYEFVFGSKPEFIVDGVVEPLYTAPVRTKDLTNEELDALWYGNTKRGWRGLFRAVIAADREKNK